MNIVPPCADFSSHVQELERADFGETEEKELQEDFTELRRWVEKLPPMVDRPCAFPFSNSVLIAASIQSLAKSSGQAITLLRLGVRKIFTPVNGPARGYGGLNFSRCSVC